MHIKKLAAAATLLAAAALPGIAQAATATASVNVRSGPGTYFPAIGLLSRGQEVRLLGRNWQGTWVNIEAPGYIRGWVSAQYIWSRYPLYELPVIQ